jgi:hypothetical protein
MFITKYTKRATAFRPEPDQFHPHPNTPPCHPLQLCLQSDTFRFPDESFLRLCQIILFGESSNYVTLCSLITLLHVMTVVIK